MRPMSFEYHAPRSIAEACDLLAQSVGEARILAGGQSLVPTMNLRLAAPAALIDIKHLVEMRSITLKESSVAIGARATHSDVVHSAELAEVHPLLPAVARRIGHAAIRARGTFGGSIAHADPASEWPAVLLATKGRVKAVSVRGERWIEADDFLVGIFTTALAADEILTEVELPRPRADERWCFQEFARQSGAFATAMVLVRASFDENGRPTQPRIVVGGCAGRPLAPAVDWSPVTDCPPSPGAIEEVARQVGEALEPEDDAHTSAEDRRQIATVLARRALEKVLLPSPATTS